MESNRINYIGLVLGIILLVPPLISVFVFFTQIIGWNTSLFGSLDSSIWTGNIDIDYFSSSHLDADDKRVAYGGGGGGGGFTSALPLYFGLMAIAGAILISNSTKK